VFVFLLVVCGTELREVLRGAAARRRRALRFLNAIGVVVAVLASIFRGVSRTDYGKRSRLGT